jgi:hypothetical protein
MECCLKVERIVEVRACVRVELSIRVPSGTCGNRSKRRLGRAREIRAGLSPLLALMKEAEISVGML